MVRRPKFDVGGRRTSSQALGHTGDPCGRPPKKRGERRSSKHCVPNRRNAWLVTRRCALNREVRAAPRAIFEAEGA